MFVLPPESILLLPPPPWIKRGTPEWDAYRQRRAEAEKRQHANDRLVWATAIVLGLAFPMAGLGFIVLAYVWAMVHGLM